MKWVLVQNIPINNVPAIMGDDEGRTVKFDSRHVAEAFIERSGENPEDIMVVPEMETT